MWLVLTGGLPELCRTDGGYEPDLFITTSTRTLARWWLGEIDWGGAVESGAFNVSGPSNLTREFSTWFRGYGLAPVALSVAE